MTPFLAALALIAIGTLTGIGAMRIFIQAREARHELKLGSAGQIRMLSHWIFAVIWGAAIWFVATILGDWHATGDLAGAIDRGWLRLQILLEILAALGDD